MLYDPAIAEPEGNRFQQGRTLECTYLQLLKEVTEIAHAAIAADTLIHDAGYHCPMGTICRRTTPFTESPDPDILEPDATYSQAH